MHLTETCEEDEPRLITNVATRSGPVADGAMTPEIHESLQENDLLPERHIVDTGYLDADRLVQTQRDVGVDMVGPTRPDDTWQVREKTGFDAAQFAIDGKKQEAPCPEGHRSLSWSQTVDRGSM